jgi:hypothetical protein
VEIVLTRISDGQDWKRALLADSGAGTDRSGPDLILLEADCLLGGGRIDRPVRLGGAYTGTFPTYVLRVRIPALGFAGHMLAVGASRTPASLDGLACFRFLNRFTFGNFGDPHQFGLEI